MKSEMQFEETVILLDAAYIDKVTGHLIDHFSKLLDRVLPRAEWALFLETLVLDAGLRPEEGKETSERIIQCVIVYDDWSAELNHIVPQDVAGSLDNIAFRSRLGEFVLNSFNPSGMADREEFFLESLKLIAGAQEVKRLLVAGDEQACGHQIYEILQGAQGKDRITVFGMNPPPPQQATDWETLGFAVLRALRIRSEEL